MSTTTEPSSGVHNIGVIVVHGIGEQKRFEFLDQTTRSIVTALKQQAAPELPITVTVDIHAVAGGPFHADQESWSSGPPGPVVAWVATGGVPTHRIHFHEVWWADINEPYSIAKQLRFWLWGLAIWAYPSQGKTIAHGHRHVSRPTDMEPGFAARRLELLLVCALFLLAGPTVGLVMAALQRVFNLRSSPPILRVLTNFMSGVKLFVQRRRFGPGLGFTPPRLDLLDTLDDPPRVSVRRRVIRAIAQVACAGYDRWYILAHSQGTVAAFNGLMETAAAWPGYFDAEGWQKLVEHQLAGPAPGVVGASTMPAHPVWAPPDHVAYRARIFANFHGLLTFGSPLEKFATIWPSRVPISLEPAFPASAVWLNVFDPRDPVSGVLTSYQGHGTTCPPPVDIGYATYWVLLASHLQYLAWHGSGCIADGIASWLLHDDPTVLISGREGGIGRFAPDSSQRHSRRIVSLLQWFVVYLVAAVLAALAVHIVIHWLHPPPPPSNAVATHGAVVPPTKAAHPIMDWIGLDRASFWWTALAAPFVSVLITLLVGSIARAFMFDPDGKDAIIPAESHIVLPRIGPGPNTPSSA